MREQLDNGLTVLLEPVRAAPAVALQCWVKVGSADERPDEEGLAHVHEHMLFKGTSRRGVGEIAREVEARGGDINAWTSFDQTVYHLVLASRYLADGLDILADALQHSAFDEKELARELEVIVEEIARSEDTPSRKLSKEMFRQAYPRHPYGKPVIGTVESVRGFTREKVLAFYEKHYAPGQMTLVVTGDFEPAEAMAQVRRLFGAMPVRPPATGPRDADGPPRASGSVLAENVREAYLSLAFRAGDLHDPSVAALDVLSVILGQGDASRLQLEVKREKRLASEIYAYAYTPRDPGLVVASATLPPEKLEACAAAVARELGRLVREPAGEAELAAAKSIIEADAVYQRETVQGLARKLGYYEAVAGSADFERQYHERVAALTAEDVRAAAERFLVPEHAVASAMVPQGSPAAKLEGAALLALVQDAMRAELAAPRPAPAKEPGAAPPGPSLVFTRRAPADAGIQVKRLASGATVIVKPEAAVPLVALRAVWRGGQRAESEADSGLAQLLARTLTKGTARRSAQEVARLVDEMAGTLGGAAGKNSLGLRGELLARHFDRGFRLFAECLREPGLEPAEVERERQIQLEEIRTRDDNPSGAAFDLFSETLYRAHPYRLARAGTERSLAALDPGALRRALAAQYPRSRMTLAVVGDVEPGQAFELAEELFGARAPEGEPERTPPPEPPPEARRAGRRTLDKKQTHLVYGFPGTTVRDPDRFALECLASVLAGQGGRLFVELRDKRSMAYSVTAFSLEGLDPGYFAVYMGTSPEKVDAALGGIEEELARVVEHGVTQEELDRARRYLVGSHLIGLQKNSARAAVMSVDHAYGLGADSYAKYGAQIDAVTRDDVLRVARKYLVLDRPVTAILGP